MELCAKSSQTLQFLSVVHYFNFFVDLVLTSQAGTGRVLFINNAQKAQNTPRQTMHAIVDQKKLAENNIAGLTTILEIKQGKRNDLPDTRPDLTETQVRLAIAQWVNEKIRLTGGGDFLALAKV